MLKLTSAFLFTVMCSIVTLHAQTLRDIPKVRETRTDLRQVISKETQKIKSESAAVDAKKMDKIRRQVPGNNWTKKEVILISAIVVALVGLAIVLAYNTKRCVRREPSGCNFNDDINCECVEYAGD